jgi:glycosyltransferase involved in cell wall biosynthesis
MNAPSPQPQAQARQQPMPIPQPLWSRLSHRVAAGLSRRAHDLAEQLRPVRRVRGSQTAWPAHLPLVSVVIPCFNYGRYVEAAVASVQAQTLRRIELMVIDDGSTDPATRQVLAGLVERGTAVVFQCNRGLAETRNVGAAFARGKYLCYLDADDVLAPTYLERTVARLEADASLGCCYSWARCFGEEDSIWQTRDLDPWYLARSTTAPSHAVIRRAAWEAVRALNGRGFLSTWNGYFEDWVFWIELVECGWRGEAIAEPLIHYRVHGGSLGATHRAGFEAKLAALHADKWRFFHDRAYQRLLSRGLARRVVMRDARINLDPALRPAAPAVPGAGAPALPASP